MSKHCLSEKWVHHRISVLKRLFNSVHMTRGDVWAWLPPASVRSLFQTGKMGVWVRGQTKNDTLNERKITCFKGTLSVSQAQAEVEYLERLIWHFITLVHVTVWRTVGVCVCMCVCTWVCSPRLQSYNYLCYDLIYLHNVKHHDAKQEVEAWSTPCRGYDVMVWMLAQRSMSSWRLLSVNLSVPADKELYDI